MMVANVQCVPCGYDTRMHNTFFCLLTVTPATFAHNIPASDFFPSESEAPAEVGFGSMGGSFASSRGSLPGIPPMATAAYKPARGAPPHNPQNVWKCPGKSNNQCALLQGPTLGKSQRQTTRSLTSLRAQRPLRCPSKRLRLLRVSTPPRLLPLGAWRHPFFSLFPKNLEENKGHKSSMKR